MFSVDLAGVVRIVEARSRPKGWEDITVELLDAICEYLPQTNELLPMRGVSKHWNSVVNSVLERRAIQQWTVWNPFTKISSISPIPLLDLSLMRILDVPRRVDYEYYSTLFETADENPFPNKSLHLRHFETTVFFSRELGYNIDAGKPHRFLSNNGIHLTSLKLTMPEVAPLEFYRILQQTPNLRAFTLYLNRKTRDLKLDQLLENEEELPLSPCPSLAYLRLNVRVSRKKYPVFQMLLKLFAAQLISLEFSCTEALRFDCAFPKLQRLKIFFPPRMQFLRDGSDFRAPLQMLSLNSLDQFSMAELLQFIHNFSDSLTHFCLRICYFKDDVEERMKSKLCPVFLKVTKFAINWIREERVLNLLCTHFQPRFKNLETLQLLDFHFHSASSERREDQEEEDAKFCRDAGFWCQFPKLKTIEIYTYGDRNASFVMTRD